MMYFSNYLLMLLFVAGSRLEERETEAKTEYSKLHERYTEVIHICISLP